VAHRCNRPPLAILFCTLVLLSGICLQLDLPRKAPMAVPKFAGNRAEALLPPGPGLSSGFAQQPTKAAAKIHGKQNLLVLLGTADIHRPSRPR
jgi:hypothetical protein